MFSVQPSSTDWPGSIGFSALQPRYILLWSPKGQKFKTLVVRFLSGEKLSDELDRGLLPSIQVILEAGLDPVATHSNSDLRPAERVLLGVVILASTGFTVN